MRELKQLATWCWKEIAFYRKALEDPGTEDYKGFCHGVIITCERMLTKMEELEDTSKWADLHQQVGILRGELVQCAEWLESRPDYTEGDASVSTSARAVLATLEKGE